MSRTNIYVQLSIMGFDTVTSVLECYIILNMECFFLSFLVQNITEECRSNQSTFRMYSQASESKRNISLVGFLSTRKLDNSCIDILHNVISWSFLFTISSSRLGVNNSCRIIFQKPLIQNVRIILTWRIMFWDSFYLKNHHCFVLQSVRIARPKLLTCHI